METTNNSTQENADKQALKAAIRAQQEANKGMSQEEKQRLRKEKKEAKKAKFEAKNALKSDPIDEKAIPPLPVELQTKEEIRAQQEANKGLSQEEKQRLRKEKKEAKKALAEAKMAAKQNLPVPSSNPTESNEPLSKEEVRAQQEANKGLTQEEKQRLRKEKKLQQQQAKQQAAQKQQQQQKQQVGQKQQQQVGQKQQQPSQKQQKQPTSPTPAQSVNLFNIDRLFDQYQKAQKAQIKTTEQFKAYNINDTKSENNIHPLFRDLGLRMGNGDLTGSSHRAEELLHTIIQFVEIYPATGLVDEYYIQLNHCMEQQFRYIEKVRSPSVPMRYIYDVVMDVIMQKLIGFHGEQAKKVLLKELDIIKQGLQKRKETIVDNLVSQIDDDDVIITFGESKRITEALVKAADLFANGRDTVATFRVIVIGGRPKQNNENMLRRLVERKVSCSIAPINALPYVMESATKVFVSAAAMLANGYALADIGTALVATTCKTYHIPLIVVADTTKFSKEVRLESISKNEMNTPNSFRPSMLPSVSTSRIENNWILENHEQIEHLKLFNLCYDLVPASLISGIVTEISIIPASSVASIIREYENDMLMKKTNYHCLF